MARAWWMVAVLVVAASCSRDSGVAYPPAVLEFAVVADGSAAPSAGTRTVTHAGVELVIEAPRRFRLDRVAMGRDNLGYPAIEFRIHGSEAKEFERWTGEIVDRRLAILIEGEVVTAPVVQSSLPGEGIISGGAGDFTEAEVRTLYARLRAGN